MDEPLRNVIIFWLPSLFRYGVEANTSNILQLHSVPYLCTLQSEHSQHSKAKLPLCSALYYSVESQQYKHFQTKWIETAIQRKLIYRNEFKRRVRFVFLLIEGKHCTHPAYVTHILCFIYDEITITTLYKCYRRAHSTECIVFGRLKFGPFLLNKREKRAKKNVRKYIIAKYLFALISPQHNISEQSSLATNRYGTFIRWANALIFRFSNKKKYTHLHSHRWLYWQSGFTFPSEVMKMISSDQRLCISNSLWDK